MNESFGAGDRISSVMLVSRLGAGADGEVWEGRDQTLERRVAVKILRDELRASRSDVDRFLGEARRLAQLEHDHIVRIHAMVEHPPSIVMEFLEGRTLREILGSGPLTWERTRRLLGQLCGATQAVHDLGIVHRDLKPENIMVVSRDGVECCKLLDFGIAGSGDATRRHRGAGTPGYMAPEQIVGGVVDARSDIYSLGAIAYEMITGSPVLIGETTETLLMRHLDEEPDPPSLLRDAGSATFRDELDATILRAVAKDPRERFASCDEFAAALLAIPAENLPSPDKRPTRRIIPLAAAVGVLGCAGLLWGFSPTASPPLRPLLTISKPSSVAAASLQVSRPNSVGGGMDLAAVVPAPDEAEPPRVVDRRRWHEPHRPAKPTSGAASRPRWVDPRP